MACALPESPNSVLRVELTCPVCLDLYLEPHQLHCGHNFCLRCLQRLFQPKRTIFHCPECRDACFPTDSQKNFKLSNIADDYRNRRQEIYQRATRGPSPLAKTPVMVLCDYCPPAAAQAQRLGPATRGTTRPVKPAVKLCLKCEVMMCQEHLMPHLELPVFRDHPLTDPTEYTDLRKMKCLDHDEIYSYYCMDEKIFVCNACVVEGGHKEHTIKTLRNASKDLKVALDFQLNTVETNSTNTEVKLQIENEKDRINKNFVKVSRNYMRRLRARMHFKVDGFVGRLLGLVHNHCDHNALYIQENIRKIKEDQVRLQQVRTDILGTMSENPFLFIDAYKKKEEQLQKQLQRCLFNPEGIEWRIAGDLGVQMAGEISAFTPLLDIILAELLALCHFPVEEEALEDEELDITYSILEAIIEEDEVEEEDDYYDGEDEGMREEDEEEDMGYEEVGEYEEEGVGDEEVGEEEEDVGEEEEEEEEEEDVGEYDTADVGDEEVGEYVEEDMGDEEQGEYDEEEGEGEDVEG